MSSIYVFSYFPFGFEGRIWDLIVSVPDHCLSFYFDLKVKISLHQSLNSSKGVIRCPELRPCSDKEIIDNLTDQGSVPT